MDIEGTAMAIREIVMEYFKGDCIQKLVDNPYLEVKTVNPPQRGTYYFERRQRENEQSKMVLLAGSPLFTMKKLPDKVTFHEVVMMRSPQMRELSRLLVDFLDEYLPAVERSYHDKPVEYR